MLQLDGGFGLPNHDRQPNLGGSAFALAALQDKPAAGLLAHTVDHRQSETRALTDALGREEGLGGMRERLFVHALAAIGHRKTDIAAGSEMILLLGEPFHACGDDDRAASGHGVTCVDCEIEQREFELIGVRSRRWKTEREPRLDVNGGPERAPQQIGHAVHKSGDIDRFGLHTRSARSRSSSMTGEMFSWTILTTWPSRWTAVTYSTLAQRI